MKHVTIHEYLRTFSDSEEDYPVTPPTKSLYDEEESGAVDVRSDPHYSLFDFIEAYGSIPSGTDSPTSIKDFADSAEPAVSNNSEEPASE